MFSQIWRVVTLTLLRPMYKWLLRKITGQCELQRIVYGTEQGARRTLKIETSLKHSRYAASTNVIAEENVNIDQSLSAITKLKGISDEVHPLFKPALKICLCQICGYNSLLAEVEAMRKIPFSSENEEHEALLMDLWRTLCPSTSLEGRISKQWGDIGFQGDDPMTDFRGMGILGLQNLIFLVIQHTEVARQLLSHSNHPKYGYSFAIVGINITGMAYKLLKKGHLKTHLYNTVYRAPSMEHFHHIYCCLFCDFDKFWREEEPKDIMQFNIVRKKYEDKIIKLLRGDKSYTLKGLFEVSK